MSADGRVAVIRAALESARQAGEPVGADAGREIRVCAGTTCRTAGSAAVREAISSELASRGLTDQVRVVETGCQGLCAQGPTVLIDPQGIFYPRVTARHVPRIIEASVVGNGVVEDLLYRHPKTGRPVAYEKDVPFFALQTRAVLTLAGRIDPRSIDDYLAVRGYGALATVLADSDPEAVISLAEKSGLGDGDGLLAGSRWRNTRAAAGGGRAVVCDAGQGDPGAFGNRFLLEADPHRVLEGMIIAAYAVGACEGHVHIRHDHHSSAEVLRVALGQCRERGLLGANILGSGFDLDISVNAGAGAFVCGEETASVAAAGERPAVSCARPLLSVSESLRDRPSSISDARTYAAVPWIVEHGAAAYAALGIGEARGTQVISLAGKVRNGGLLEVPAGTTLGRVIFEIGGGVPSGRTLKAAQLGGSAAGVCVPTELLDIRVSPKHLESIAATSGSIVVLDDTTCMVDLARHLLRAGQRESCGKCAPCRLGVQRMIEVLERITRGHGREGDVELLEELSHFLEDGALCVLGRSAPSPVLATIRHFHDEYQAHIKDKRCPAGHCKELVSHPAAVTVPSSTPEAPTCG